MICIVHPYEYYRNFGISKVKFRLATTLAKVDFSNLFLLYLVTCVTVYIASKSQLLQVFLIM